MMDFIRAQQPALKGLLMPVADKPDLVDLEYADDTLFFLHYSPDILDTIRDALEVFCVASGAHINWHKSYGILAGSEDFPTWGPRDFTWLGPRETCRYLGFQVELDVRAAVFSNHAIYEEEVVLLVLSASLFGGPSIGGQPGDKRTPQLVLLDHGLYKELSPTLRSDYAALWKALVFADVNEIKKQSVKLGAGEDLYILFAGMLTMRPWKRIIQQDINHLKIDGTEEDKEEIQMYASQLVSEISLLLQRLPREILLLLKTNDCLRAVDYCLGSSVNSFVIIARESSRALADLKAHGSRSIRSRLSARLDMLKVEIRLLILRLLEWMMLFRRSFKLQHSY
ncbi:hypothetical protein L7F22_064975 [Adiantum nelumboides]|nr:hypothetical protein [Adiantum nelumboides]